MKKENQRMIAPRELANIARLIGFHEGLKRMWNDNQFPGLEWYERHIKPLYEPALMEINTYFTEEMRPQIIVLQNLLRENSIIPQIQTDCIEMMHKIKRYGKPLVLTLIDEDEPNTYQKALEMYIDGIEPDIKKGNSWLYQKYREWVNYFENSNFPPIKLKEKTIQEYLNVLSPERKRKINI